MVTYQQWFTVVHKVGSRKGASTAAQRASLTSDLADYWNANKTDLEAMTKAEARQLAEQIVSV